MFDQLADGRQCRAEKLNMPRNTISDPLDRIGRDLSPVLARLGSIRPLSAAEVELISGLGTRCRVLAAGSMLLEEGSPVSRASYVLSGWACRQTTIPDGRRQIVSFILPGEGAGLCRRPRPLAFTTTVALTRLVVADATPLLSEDSAAAVGLKDVLELAAALDEKRLINHVLRLGRLTAYERFCSLLLDLADRLEQIGGSHQEGFALPTTQEVLSDALGLSVVHVNRTLQQMKRDGVMDLRGGTLRIIDRDSMERRAGLY